jgi:isopropylmalate/homocitrate/citramalate synthase
MTNTYPRLSKADRDALETARETMDRKMARLRDVVPCVVDLSCREGSLPAPYGHTLEDKRELLRLARAFGFTDIAIAAYFDFENVDEVFARELKESGDSMDGFFCNLSMVQTEADRPLEPSYAMERIKQAGIPNVLALAEIRPLTLQRRGRAYDDLFRDFEVNIAYLRDTLLPPASERRGRIYLRFLDIFDAWDEDPELVVKLLKLLETLPIHAVIYEDVRGTHFPFQTAELVKLIRRFTPPPRLILVHPHSGNGLEDATTIEAVIAGADGVWAGLTPHAAQGAHGSSAMLLSNLARAGNPHVAELFQLERLMQICDAMSRIHMGEPIHKDHPVIGERAYHYLDPAFIQADLPCDLAPEMIGQKAGWRVTPAWSSPHAMSQRLIQLGYAPEIAENDELIRTMRIIMSQANIAGKRIEFDSPEEMTKLVEAAQARLAAEQESAAE